MTVPAMQPTEPESPAWLRGEAPVQLTFPEGIPGFASYRSFRLEPVGGPLFWLRSSEEHGPDFLVVEPLAFLPDYKVEPEPWMLASLGVSQVDELVTLAMVTLPAGAGEPATMNLQGPILVNPSEGIGRQVVLPDSALGPRTPIPVGL